MRLAQSAFIIVAGLSAIAAFNQTWANGDEFYRFNALDPNDLESQVIFAGSVKDTDGKRLQDAKVTISLTVTTARGEKVVSYNAYTSVTGRYRSFDVGSVVLTLEEVYMVVDPAQVTVTASKRGYTMVRSFSRSKPGLMTGVFEIDFTLASISQEGSVRGK